MGPRWGTQEGGLLKVRKKGRRHHYFVNVEAQFPDPLLSHITIGDVVKAIRL